MATGPILDFPISANISFCQVLRVKSSVTFPLFPLSLSHIYPVNNQFLLILFFWGGCYSYTCLSVPFPVFHPSLTFIVPPLNDNNNLPTVLLLLWCIFFLRRLSHYCYITYKIKSKALNHSAYIILNHIISITYYYILTKTLYYRQTDHSKIPCLFPSCIFVHSIACILQCHLSYLNTTHSSSLYSNPTSVMKHYNFPL